MKNEKTAAHIDRSEVEAEGENITDTIAKMQQAARQKMADDQAQTPDPEMLKNVPAFMKYMARVHAMENMAVEMVNEMATDPELDVTDHEFFLQQGLVFMQTGCMWMSRALMEKQRQNPGIHAGPPPGTTTQ